MNYIILNGQKSTEIPGLMIEQLPKITKPKMRVETETVDGRDGDIITPLGYESYDRDVKIGLRGKYNIDDITAYFNDNRSGSVVFSNESDKRYEFYQYEKIDFEALLRFKEATVTFHVQPFKSAVNEETKEAFADESSAESAEGEDGLQKLTLSPTYSRAHLTDFKVYGKIEEVEESYNGFTYCTLYTLLGGKSLQFSDEAGNSKTAVIYLGAEELCSLPLGDVTYNDMIYKKSGKWYKKTAVKKRYLSDLLLIEENTGEPAIFTQNGTLFYYFKKSETDLSFGNTDKIPVACSAAEYYEDIKTNAAPGRIFSSYSKDYYVIGFPMDKTASDIKAYLNGSDFYVNGENSRAVLYTPLKEPEIKEITDSLIVSSLDSLLTETLYDSETAITVLKANENSVSPKIAASSSFASLKIKNEGNKEAKPVITVKGSDTGKIYLNGSLVFLVAFKEKDTITIDISEMESRTGTVLRNRNVSGNYDSFLLSPGDNTIETEGINEITVTGYSRWI